MLRLLGRKSSSNVRKVLWALEELQLRYEREDVGGEFGRNRDPEFLALAGASHRARAAPESAALVRRPGGSAGVCFQRSGVSAAYWRVAPSQCSSALPSTKRYMSNQVVVKGLPFESVPDRGVATIT